MGINFNFGLGGKTGNNDNGTAGAADPSTVITADPSAGSTPPPTEPIMVQPPAEAAAPTPVAATPNFGDDITINVTDAPAVAPDPSTLTGDIQITESAVIGSFLNIIIYTGFISVW